MATIGTPAQQFVPVQEVRDGIVVLKDGTLCTVVLVSSINLSLKSAEEQQATLQQFQNFLNTIDFPIQIVVQSRRYDIRPYILTLENRLKDQTEQLLQVQTREYIQFIQTFTEQVNIMRKSFFVVIPYIPPVLAQKGGVGKVFSFLRKAPTPGTVSDFEEERTQLEERVSVVDQGLTRLGLRLVQLGTQEVIEVLYKTFNPGETSTSNTSQSQ
ncbi:MAG TPA: TraC family protein [Candidatus Paceibacterota bacterium]|jgi:type IV secretory pathway VirB4 component|nr:TraC family protein [Candidatus Paceibacterota bacterium]